MKIHPPLQITSRLTVGYQFPDKVTISISLADMPGDDKRLRFHYWIDFPDGYTYENDDLQSGQIRVVGEHPFQRALDDLLAFLMEDDISWPLVISNWVKQNIDDIEMLQLELSDSTLIEE